METRGSVLVRRLQRTLHKTLRKTLRKIFPTSTQSPWTNPTALAALAAAHASEATTHLPYELTAAQWALESGWGNHQPQNNCFGIKSYPGCAGTQQLKTQEWINGKLLWVMREFATFPTLEDCFNYHGRLITQGQSYQKAWSDYVRTMDLHQLILGVAPIYATDPQYTLKLLELVGTLPKNELTY